MADRRGSRGPGALLVASLVINLLVVAGLGALVVKKGGLPWLQHHASELLGHVSSAPHVHGFPSTTLDVYRHLPVLPGDIVFFGDDLLADGEWHEWLDDPRAKNRAVEGDDVGTLLARAPSVIAGRPRHVIVSGGFVDLRAQEPPARTRQAYAELIARLAGADSCDVWLLPELPLNEALYARWIETDEPDLHVPTADEVNALDAAVRGLAAGRKHVHVVDLSDFLDASGQLDARWTLDGLHLSGAGYARLAARLRRELGLAAPGAPATSAAAPAR